jgi:hypothetical protein
MPQVSRECLNNNTKKRGRGRPPLNRKKNKYTMSDKVLSTRHSTRTGETRIHIQTAKKIGILKVKNNIRGINAAINDCSKACGDSLVIHQLLIRGFDEDLQKASIVSFLLHMENKLAGVKGGKFVTKYEEITKATGVQRIKLGNIIKNLKLSGILQVKKEGVPAMPHYRIDHDMLKQLIMERVLNYKDPLLESGIVEIV